MPEGEWTQRHFREEYVSDAGIIGFRGKAANAGDAYWWNHMPAQMIRRRLGEHIWSPYFKFCVIRNPFEKAISAFYYWKRRQFRKRRRRKSQKGEWTDQDPQLFENWLERGRGPMDRNLFCIKGQFALDDVIRHEILAADMQRICERLGLPWDPERLPTFKPASARRGHGTAAVHAALAPVGAQGLPLRAALLLL
jgi:hypothetical protein